MQQVQTVPSIRVRTSSLGNVAELQRNFAEDGYLVLRGVVSKEKLSDLRARVIAEYDRAKISGDLFSGGGNLAGHLNCVPGEAARSIYGELRERGVIDVVKAISPKVVRDPNIGCNLNLPGSIVQHFHSDSNYYVEDFMICNVAVVDTTTENGAIEIIPASHHRFYPFWRFAVERVARRGIRVPAQQGDLLVRSSNLWHRGMPNLTSTPRPMLAFTWEEGGSRRPDPFAVDGGGIKFHPNWYRPNLLGRMRERVYMAAPFTYDAYRFARSLVGNKGYTR